MSLKQGTYQFAYRLINKATKKYSKYSLMTNPVSVYDKDINNVGVSEIGDNVDSGISIRIYFTSKERSFYDYYQVVVIKNVIGSSVPDTKGYQLSPQQITAEFADVTYSGNSEEVAIDISELTLSTQAIDSVGTITSKLNRLIAGDVKYKPLDYDNGNPEVANTTDVAIKSLGRGYIASSPAEGAGYNDAKNASLYTGYFRGEVYRFAVSYFDEFGNFSEPHVLDLSAAANNKISGAIDFKFPKREDFGYSILGTDNSIRAIGLDIKGLDNHPSWAKGFVILRATRKRNIVGQTPVVPSCIVEMPDAEGDYPTASVDDPQVTGNPLGTIVPKNLEHGIVKSIVRDSNGAVKYAMAKSNSYPQIEATRHVVFCYVPDRMYNNSGATINLEQIGKNDNLELIDAVALKRNREDYTEGLGGLSLGDYIDTSVSTTYYALDDSDYYYDNINASKVKIYDIDNLSQSIKIRELKDVSNEQSVQALATFARNLKTSTVGDYEGIKDSLGIGYTPTNLKSNVLVLENEYIDLVYKFLDTTWASDSETYQNTDPNTRFHSGGITVNADTIPNTGTLDENGFQTNAYGAETTVSQKRSIIGIANITKGLGDDRYGDASEAREYISTGAFHVFSDEEIALNKAGSPNPIDIEVWGGDCFISLFNLKLTDRTYSIMLGENQSVTEQKWGVGSYYNNGSNLNVKRPVAVKNNAQMLSIYLESEVNGCAVAREVYGQTVIDKGISSVSEKEAGSSIDYQYNLSFSLQNSIRKYYSVNDITNNTTDFRSRIIFSDTKVYQSDIEGFDIFRTLNFRDIDETYGKVVSLARAGDDIYSIQERGISYIPSSARVLETTDLDTLSVRSGDIIGEPIYLSINQGTSRLGSVQQTSDSIYMVDDVNKEVLSIKRRTVDNLNLLGVHSYMNSLDIEDKDITSWYDESEDQYGFYVPSIREGLLFDSKIGKFITKLKFGENDYISNGIYFGGDIFSIGYGLNANASEGKLYKLFNGDYTKFLEAPYESSIKFVVNEQEGLTKVYDNAIINANANLSTIQYTTRDHQTGEISIDVPNKEDLYRIKVLRGQSGERIRGVFSEVIIKFKSTLSSLYSVSTKFRPSQRFVR